MFYGQGQLDKHRQEVRQQVQKEASDRDDAHRGLEQRLRSDMDRNSESHNARQTAIADQLAEGLLKEAKARDAHKSDIYSQMEKDRLHRQLCMQIDAKLVFSFLPSASFRPGSFVLSFFILLHPPLLSCSFFLCFCCLCMFCFCFPFFLFHHYLFLFLVLPSFFFGAVAVAILKRCKCCKCCE